MREHGMDPSNVVPVKLSDEGIWDLTESAPDLDLDAPEAVTGPWRYQEASQHRFRGGDYNVVIVEGLAPSPTR